MQKNLERCCRCQDSKVILIEIHFDGRVAYICKDCNNVRLGLGVKKQALVYRVPSFLKH